MVQPVVYNRSHAIEALVPKGGAEGVIVASGANTGGYSLFEDEVNDDVVVLREPKLNGSDLSNQVDFTDGELAAASAESSLFIDMIGRPLTPVSVAGAHRRRRRRTRRMMR